MSAVDTVAVVRKLEAFKKGWPGSMWDIKLNDTGYLTVYVWFRNRSVQHYYVNGTLTHKVLAELSKELDFLVKE